MKILLTSVSAGAGHVRAAQALSEALCLTDPEVQVRHINIMDFCSPFFRKVYEGGFIFLANKHPDVWGHLYHSLDQNKLQPLFDPLMNFIQRILCRPFLEEVKKYSPDLIVTTHFLTPQILPQFPAIHTVVTDFVAHSFWLHPSVRQYYVAHEGLIRPLAERKISPAIVKPLGIPIDPVFSKEIDTPKIRQAFGLSADLPVVLLLSGGLGFGSMDKTAEALFGLNHSFQMITVSGKNEALLQKMKALKSPDSIKTTHLGFINNMHELLSVTDLMIGKAGGLTVSEGLAKGVAMIFYGVLPGQEEVNASYVESKGGGRLARSLTEVTGYAETILSNKDLLNNMKEHSRLAGKPRAAFDIAQQILRKTY